MKTSFQISLTMKTAEAAENIIRSALDTATSMPQDEWDLLDTLCDRLLCRRLKPSIDFPQEQGAKP